MTGQIAARLQLAIAGALGGAALWAVIEAADQGSLGDYPSLVLAGFVLTFFGALLAMAGPLGLVRAAVRALGLALAAAALLALTALRYADADDVLNTPMPALAGFVVATLPIPFLIAMARSSWRDYPTLFMEAWSIVLRYAAAGAFTGLVWLVIYLSDEVLRIVGIDVISQLLQHDVVPMMLTGGVLGLGMAVIYDLADLLSPYVVLRVFRLFVPVVLAVMVVFLVALPFRGLDGLVSGLSPAMLLLTMVAGGIALVSVAIDQTDAEATQSPLILRATRGMAVVLPVIAALALWAIWLRIEDYGWTPERVFMALLAVVGLGYGLVYAVAVLRGAGWMDRIRQGNIQMALGGIALAALWLTPVLNAERISAQNQLQRFTDGRTDLADLDVYVFQRWGKPGAEALAALETLSKEPGQEALADRLNGNAPDETDHTRIVTDLAALMPVQPVTATGTRDTLLQASESYQLEDWNRVCKTSLENGKPACLMVVADLLPALPGEEAMLFLERTPDYVEITGLYLDDTGMVRTRAASRADGRIVGAAEAAALMRQYQDTPPPLTQARLNQLGTDDAGLIIVP
jgi:Domain of unknown function (DUF4153)